MLFTHHGSRHLMARRFIVCLLAENAKVLASTVAEVIAREVAKVVVLVPAKAIVVNSKRGPQ